MFLGNIVPKSSQTNQFLNVPVTFHLNVECALSTSIFLSTARKKPVKKVV